MQQERHREERRQLLEQATASRFAQMSDLEQQLKVCNSMSAAFARVLILISLQELEAQYTSSADDSDEEQSDENDEANENEDTELNGGPGEDGGVDDESEIDDEFMELYCPACKKAFKTVKA